MLALLTYRTLELAESFQRDIYNRQVRRLADHCLIRAEIPFMQERFARLRAMERWFKMGAVVFPC